MLFIARASPEKRRRVAVNPERLQEEIYLWGNGNRISSEDEEYLLAVPVFEDYSENANPEHDAWGRKKGFFSPGALFE